MNVLFRRFVQSNLISHVRNSTFKRGLLTCNINGEVKYGYDKLMPCLVFQDNKTGFKLMDISDIAKIKDSLIRSKVTDPMKQKGYIGIPNNVIIHDFELPTLNNHELIDPVGNVIEKKAHKMTRIRKRKIKKHKWKKLQKKMKFAFEKVKRKRQAKKEAAFKEEVKKILTVGEKFDAEEDLKERLSILTWEKPVNRVRGWFCPKWVADQHVENEKKKKILEERVAICLKKF